MELAIQSRSVVEPPRYWSNFAGLVDGLALEVSRQDVVPDDPLYVYEAGRADASAVVVISPIESPFLLVSRLFHVLSADYRVVAWDDPAAPFMDRTAARSTATIQRSAASLIDIVAARSLGRPHLVSWCSGALVALWALSTGRLSAASLTLIAPPSIIGESRERTAFQSHFLRTVLELANSNETTEASLYEQIRAVPKSRPITTAVDQTIFDLTHLPLRDRDAAKRYAKLVHNMCTSVPPAKAALGEQAYAALLTDICRNVPVALLHSRDDDLVSYQCSVDAAERRANVRVVLYPTGGHFVVFKHPRMLGSDIASFIRTGAEAI